MQRMQDKQIKKEGKRVNDREGERWGERWGGRMSPGRRHAGIMSAGGRSEGVFRKQFKKLEIIIYIEHFSKLKLVKK
jgi:hypothetical protein